jgi:A/G-specific adenine glycosylase
MSANTEAESLDIQRIRQALILWGHEHFQPYAWRFSSNRWHALVAEVLLLRTRASSVAPVYAKLIEEFPTAQAISQAPTDRISAILAPLGLRWRTQRLIELSTAVSKREDHIPETVEELEKLPGVGQYVSAAFLSLHLGKRALIIDSNVVRLVCRLICEPYDHEHRRSKWLRALVDRLTPEADVKHFNYALLDVSMTICTIQPKCSVCPLQQLCCTGSRRF